MLSPTQHRIKRFFDVTFAAIGIVLTWWIMLFAWLVATLETRSNGLFTQLRIGQNAEPFYVFKIKTMKTVSGIDTTVTTSHDARISKSGAFFRRTKIDELPQLFNVLFGSMSFVGPRPDVPGFADRLEGDDCMILTLRPGITGPASLKYKDEEELLSQEANPEKYNAEVIWPDKVEINKSYMQNWSLKQDIHYIMKTILG